MTANELANTLKCHVARFGDCIVVCDGREVGAAYHFDKTRQERKCVCLSLLPVHKKGEKQSPAPTKRQLISRLNGIIKKRKAGKKNDRLPKKSTTE